MRADEPADHIVTQVSAEVLARPDNAPSGQKSEPRLITAQRVVPGDVLIYTVEVRNIGPYSAEAATVVQPIPNHTVYVPDSAVGPGVDVDFSVDGGASFARPEKLKSRGAARIAHAAISEYTHIRWRLHKRLKPNAVAFVRFRVQVN